MAPPHHFHYILARDDTLPLRTACSRTHSAAGVAVVLTSVPRSCVVLPPTLFLMVLRLPGTRHAHAAACSYRAHHLALPLLLRLRCRVAPLIYRSPSMRGWFVFSRFWDNVLLARELWFSFSRFEESV